MKIVAIDRLAAPFARVAEALGALSGAWRAGLVGCLPGRLRRVLAARHSVLLVRVEGAAATVALARGELHTHVGRIGLAEPPALSERLAPLRKLKPSVLLQLPAGAVITRRVDLPVQVKKQLHQALAFEIDRLTPFQASRIYFDYRLLEGESRHGKLLIELAVCLREQVTPWIERLRLERASPEIVAWEGAWQGANLLPVADRRANPGAGQLRKRLLVAAVMVLAVAAAVSPLWQKREQVVTLNVAVGELRPKAEKAAALRKKIEESRKEVQLAVNQKNREPRLVDLLLALSERLPDDTYVQNLEYTRGAGQVRGESLKATALIRALEDAPGIDGVSFQSPVVQVPNTGKERFHLSFQYTRDEGP